MSDAAAEPEGPAIRRAGPDDLDRLLPLVADFHAFEGVAMTDDQRHCIIATLLAEPFRGSIWVAEDAGRLVGYIALCHGYSIEFGGQDAFLDEIFVVPEARGRGLGARLVAAMRAGARAAGINAVHLEVHVGNRSAQRFYSGFGFVHRTHYNLMSTRLDGSGEQPERGSEPGRVVSPVVESPPPKNASSPRRRRSF